MDQTVYRDSLKIALPTLPIQLALNLMRLSCRKLIKNLGYCASFIHRWQLSTWVGIDISVDWATGTVSSNQEEMPIWIFMPEKSWNIFLPVLYQ